jgi:hypothetical protein
VSLELRFQAGPIAQAWAGLYRAADRSPLPQGIAVGPAAAGAYIKLVWRGSPWRIAREIMPEGAQGGQGRVAIVLFSGGKDSAAAALRAAAAGYEPILLYAQGINPAYPEEIEAARRMAAALAMPLRIVEVRARRGAYIENPTKNQLLLACAADIGLRWGASLLSAGIMAADQSPNMPFGAGLSDGADCQGAAADWIERFVPGLRVERAPIRNDTDSLLEVARAGLLPLAQSCMTGVRFRGSLRTRNMAKHGVDLMPNRCGSCYKCALEFLTLGLAGMGQRSQGYEAHCADILTDSAERISGQRMPRADALRLFIDPQQVDVAALG